MGTLHSPRAQHVNARDITAARDALEGFRRVNNAEPSPIGLQVSWSVWAVRLALALATTLNGIDEARSRTLGERQREVLALALDDACEYRMPSGGCADCDVYPAGLCSDHGADLDRTDDYIQLARELGIEVGQ